MHVPRKLGAASSTLPVLLVGLVTLALGSCSKDSGDKPSLAGAAQKREAARVRTTPIERREMVKTLTTTVNVESLNEIQVFSRAAGHVTEIFVEEGDRVAEGAELAALDPRDADVALAEAKVALREAQDTLPTARLAKEEAKERLERAKLTHEQAIRDVERNEQAGLISANDLEKLKLQRDQAFRDQEAARLAHESSILDEKAAGTAIARAQLGVDRQTLALSYTRIVAPFAGVIAERAIKVGDSVGQGAYAFILTDPDQLRALIYRPQRELALFQGPPAGNGSGTYEAENGPPEIEIQATAEALPGVTFRGNVEFVSPTIDATSGSFRITVRLAPLEDGPRLMPGMLVRLEIVTERHPDALVVPKRSLRREGEVAFLFVVEDGTARRVDVEEGFSGDDSVEVTPAEPGGLAAGAHVVVIGNRDLEDGSEVQADTWGEGNEAAGETPASPDAGDAR